MNYILFITSFFVVLSALNKPNISIFIEMLPQLYDLISNFFLKKYLKILRFLKIISYIS